MEAVVFKLRSRRQEEPNRQKKGLGADVSDRDLENSLL